MKKILIILAAVALLCLGLYSCNTTKDCPAYDNHRQSSM